MIGVVLMIKINENYVIDSDDNQVILKEKRVVQEGKTGRKCGLRPHLF